MKMNDLEKKTMFGIYWDEVFDTVEQEYPLTPKKQKECMEDIECQMKIYKRKISYLERIKEIITSIKEKK